MKVDEGRWMWVYLNYTNHGGVAVYITMIHIWSSIRRSLSGCSLVSHPGMRIRHVNSRHLEKREDLGNEVDVMSLSNFGTKISCSVPSRRRDFARLNWYLFPRTVLFIAVCVSVYSSDGKRQVLPLSPPAECKPGDRVVVQGYEHETAGGEWIIEHNTLGSLWLVPSRLSCRVLQLPTKETRETTGDESAVHWCPISLAHHAGEESVAWRVK